MVTKIEKTLKEISSSWFLSEPLLFSVLCTHSFVPNASMSVPFRSGQMRIEYSPSILKDAEKSMIDAYLKIEMYRILLQHPYVRQPSGCHKNLLLIASDVTIYALLYRQKNLEPSLQQLIQNLPGILYLKNQAVRFGMLEHPLGPKWKDTPELKFYQKNLQISHENGDLLILDDLNFEQWYKKIYFLVKETSIAGENAGTDENAQLPGEEASELWEENQEAQNELSRQVQKAEIDQGWGSLGGSAVRAVKAGEDFSFDYRRALAQFRTSIVSANRSLTRMKPSRRYGFKAMGSRYERKANILIAVDVSGSITDESFEHFYKAINNFFFLGIIEKIDLIFFDVNLKNTKPITFHKKIDLSQIKGRGGTNFQPVFDYYFEHTSTYNGLIIFTDGEGNIPVLNGKRGNVLWILDSRLAWEKSKPWIGTLSGHKSTYLPF